MCHFHQKAVVGAERVKYEIVKRRRQRVLPLRRGLDEQTNSEWQFLFTKYPEVREDRTFATKHEWQSKQTIKKLRKFSKF